MKIAVICDTSYQLMNMLNYVYHLRQDGASDEIDLFVGQQFYNCKCITQRISAENLFDHVYSFNTKQHAVGIKMKLSRVIDIVFPVRSMRGQMIDHIDFKHQHYDRILASMVTHFSASMVFAYPDAELIYFDDGTGSYLHELNASMISSFNQKIYRLLGRDLDCLTAKEILLNNPSFANEEVAPKAIALPSLLNVPKDLLAIFKRVWDYSADGYYAKYPIIFLSSPPTSQREIVAYEILLKSLTPVRDACLLRPHPSHKDIHSNGIEIDDHREMWEFICADQISDDHVLISNFSTAQMIPKMFFDKEPTVIFVCKMIFQYIDQPTQDNIMALINRIKEKYRNPEKVYTPESEEELSEILKNLCIKNKWGIDLEKF